MFLTINDLARLEACEEGIKWFQRWFPNGGELKDVITHKYVSPEMLHWGYTHLTTTKEEQELYYDKLDINTSNRWTVYESDKITDSTYISRCSRVKNSAFVFSSEDVLQSDNISACSNIEGSSQIFNSEFVYDSQQVYQSKNITESKNIINSDYVIRSNDVMNAAVVTNSFAIQGLCIDATKQIQNCGFIIDSINLKNCLFCANVQDKEYMLFNQPIEPVQFDMIMKQLRGILGDWHAELVKGDWPKETIPLDFPVIQCNVMKQFANLPKAFWRWVVTLPNYDNNILYSIIFQDQATI